MQGELLPGAKNAMRTEEVLTSSLAVLDGVWAEATGSLRAEGVDQLRAREVAAMAAMGRWAYRSAMVRTESRGMHYRDDFPTLDEGQRHRVLSGGLDFVWTRVDEAPLDTWAEVAHDDLLRSAS